MDVKKIEWTINIPGREDWIAIPDQPFEKLKWNSEDFSPVSGFTFRLEMTYSMDKDKILTKVALKNCENKKVFVKSWVLRRPGDRCWIIFDNLILKPNADSDPKFCKYNEKKYNNESLFKTTLISELEINADFFPRTITDDLERELEREWKNPLSGDTILECEGTELRCHSFILCARSDVFRAFLSNPGFVEGKDRKIKFPYMDLKTLREMLKYLYTDSFNGEFDDVPALFLAADLYDLQGLKSLCEGLLVENIDIGNAIEYFYLAYLHDVKKLLDSSGNFIRTHFELVKNTEGWKILTDKNKELEEILLEKFLQGLQIV